MSRFFITVATISLLCYLASSQASNQEANQGTSNDYLNKAIIPLLCQIASNSQAVSSEVTKICGECPDGSYKVNSGSQSCMQCPAGKFAARGAASCADCTAGKFSEAGQAECKLCPAGTFSATPGSQQCSKCTSVFQYSNPGSSSCRSCPNWGLSNDGVGCLEKVNITHCSASSEFPDHFCRKAIDGSRDGSAFEYVFATLYTGDRFFIGNLANPIVVKKVIFWLRTDKARYSQFNNIEVYTLSGAASTPTLCGSFTNTDKDYAVFDCNREANAIKVVRIDSSGYLGFVEAEVYV